MRRGYAVVGLFATLLLAEVVLRWGVGLGDPPIAILDPELEYRLKPGVYHRWGNRIEINEIGLRGRPVVPEALPGTRRVLLVGDSVVYGNHRLDQSETIAAGITAKANCPTETISVAVSSWGPPNQAAFLARHGTLNADAAVIVVSSHDLRDVPTNDPNILPYRLRAPWTAIEDAATAVLERIRLSSAMPQHSGIDREAIATAALDDMLLQLRDAGIATTVIFHPTLSEREQLTSPRSAGRLAEMAKRRDARFADASKAFDAEGAYQDNIHPNELGAARFAEMILDLLPCGLSRSP